MSVIEVDVGEEGGYVKLGCAGWDALWRAGEGEAGCVSCFGGDGGMEFLREAGEIC